MRKQKKNIKVGLPPGTIIYEGDFPPNQTKIEIIDYNDKDYHINSVQNVDLIPNQDSTKIRWIKIQGLADMQKIEQVCTPYSIHPLVLEDIFAIGQRSKIEDYGDYLYIVMRRIDFNENSEKFEFEQISIILGSNYVISIQEKESSIFQPVLDRIITPKGRIRYLEADYLAYSILDVNIDTFFSSLETLGYIIEEIENKIINEPNPAILQQIYYLKRMMIDIKKSIWPLREVISKIQRGDTNLISSNLQIYFRDLYDHIFRLSDSIENYRDIIFGMLEMHLSSVSNKMNDIMKTLTIISTIFIPLSFLAGFYSMNFKYMPELDFKYSYPILIFIMLMLTSGMLIFFRRKGWV